MVNSQTKINIIQYLADGEFHSGSELALRLGISRSAIWKQIKGFDELGLEVFAVPGKGYRLSSPLELLDHSTITSFLTPSVIERVTRMEIHHQIDSTNQYLIRSAASADSTGTVCLAEMQTAGRGRYGRRWVSPFGHNIYLSLLWRFNQGPAILSGLSLAVGVAVMRSLCLIGISDAGLKWPNDILYRRQKLGGILIEVTGESNGPFVAVIGLGLNVKISAQGGRLISQDWTDLEHLLGHRLPSRNALVSIILNELVPILSDYENTGIQPYLSEWRRWDCVRGSEVTLYVGNSEVHGEVLGITDDGLLMIRDKSGRLSQYASGEISFRK